MSAQASNMRFITAFLAPLAATTAHAALIGICNGDEPDKTCLALDAPDKECVTVPDEYKNTIVSVRLLRGYSCNSYEVPCREETLLVSDIQGVVNELRDGSKTSGFICKDAPENPPDEGGNSGE